MSGSANNAARVRQLRPVEVGPDLKLLRNYVAGSLSEQDRLELEERMAHDPELVQEVEQLLRFREGLHMVTSEGYFRRAALRPRQKSAWRLKAWLPFLAAAAIAGIAILLWQNRIVSSRALLSASVRAPVAGHVMLVATRSADEPDLYPPANGPIEFGVYREAAAPNARFRFTLTRIDDDPGKPLGSLSGLKVGPDHYIRAYADAARLGPGSYVLRVESEDAPASAETFSFTFRTR